MLPIHAVLRSVILCTACAMMCSVLAVPSKAQDQPPIEIFGGYSWLNTPIRIGQFVPAFPGTTCPPNCTTIQTSPNTSLNGWAIAGQYRMWGPLGVFADIGANYKTVHGSNVHRQNYLFGGQFSVGRTVSPFAQGFIGIAHGSQGATTNSLFFSIGSDTSFAAGFGAGLDIRPVRHFAYRILQVDYLHTKLWGQGQNQVRLTTGVIVRF